MADPFHVLAGIGFTISTIGFLIGGIGSFMDATDTLLRANRKTLDYRSRLQACHQMLETWCATWCDKGKPFPDSFYRYYLGAEDYSNLVGTMIEIGTKVRELEKRLEGYCKNRIIHDTRSPQSRRKEYDEMIEKLRAKGHEAYAEWLRQYAINPPREIIKLSPSQRLGFMVCINTRLDKRISSFETNIKNLKDVTAASVRRRRHLSVANDDSEVQQERIQLVEKVSKAAVQLHESCTRSDVVKEWALELRLPNLEEANDSMDFTEPYKLDFTVKVNVQPGPQPARVRIKPHLNFPRNEHGLDLAQVVQTISQVAQASSPVATSGRRSLDLSEQMINEPWQLGFLSLVFNVLESVLALVWSHVSIATLSRDAPIRIPLAPESTTLDTECFEVLETPDNVSRAVKFSLANHRLDDNSDRGSCYDGAVLALGITYWTLLLWSTPWTEKLCTCCIRWIRLNSSNRKSPVYYARELDHMGQICRDDTFKNKKLFLLGVLLAESILQSTITLSYEDNIPALLFKGQKYSVEGFKDLLRSVSGSSGHHGVDYTRSLPRKITRVIEFCLMSEECPLVSTGTQKHLWLPQLRQYEEHVLRPILDYYKAAEKSGAR